MTDRRPLTGTLLYDPFDPDAIRDPYPLYRRLHESGSSVELPAFYAKVIGSWELVSRALTDRRLSADRSRATAMQLVAGEQSTEERMGLLGSTLLTLDPPDHTRLRRLVGQAFTPRRVTQLEPRVAEICDELLDSMAESEEAELVAGLAFPLPVLVISQLLGLPPSDRELLKSWSDDVVALLEPFPTPGAMERFTVAIAELRAYLGDQVEARRRRGGEDLVAALVAARDGGDSLSDEELFGMIVLLLAAGHETTTNLIGNGVIALLRNRGQLRRLVSDPSLTENAVEELLRFDSPVQRTSRVATEDMELGAVHLAEGDFALLVLGAANRDPAQFPDPDRLDLGRRNASRHLAFGHGIHFCLGAPLARLEGRVAFRHLVDRFPNIDGDTGDLAWKQSIVLRGVERLPVRLRG